MIDGHHENVHWIDLTIMAVYIVGCMGAGMLARGKRDDAEDYFTAGGRLGGWFSTIVVGLSIAGTFFSGISFSTYPSVVYSSGILMPVRGEAATTNAARPRTAEWVRCGATPRGAVRRVAPRTT